MKTAELARKILDDKTRIQVYEVGDHPRRIRNRVRQKLYKWGIYGDVVKLATVDTQLVAMRVA